MTVVLTVLSASVYSPVYVAVVMVMPDGQVPVRGLAAGFEGVRKLVVHPVLVGTVQCVVPGCRSVGSKCVVFCVQWRQCQLVWVVQLCPFVVLVLLSWEGLDVLVACCRCRPVVASGVGLCTDFDIDIVNASPCIGSRGQLISSDMPNPGV